MRPGLLSTSLLLLSLTGCVAYRAAPVDPHAFPAHYAERAALLPTGTALGEQALLAFAIDNAPKLRDAASAWRVAEAAARSARTRPLGTLTLTAEYSHQDNPNKPWLGNVQSGVPLDIGARRGGRIESADLATLQARYDYVDMLWTTRTAIVRGLTELRAAEAERLLDREAIGLRREREQALARRVAAGEDARTIETIARTDRLAAEKRLADAEGRQAQAIEAIAAAIGVPGSALTGRPIEPAPRISEDPAPATFASWRADAVAARSDVLRAVADYDIAEAAVRTEVAKQYPDIQIGPGYTYERGITKLPFNLSLSLPPSDFNRAAIREAEARRAAAGIKLEGIQAGVWSAIDTAQAALSNATANDRRATDADLPAAILTSTQAKRSLDAGETDRTDELAAEAALLDTRIAVLDAHRIHVLARTDLDAAARPPLDAAETRLFEQAMQKLEPRK